jgi:hypothetical protein
VKRARLGGWASGVRALQGERPPKGSQIGHSSKLMPCVAQASIFHFIPLDPVSFDFIHLFHFHLTLNHLILSLFLFLFHLI